MSKYRLDLQDALKLSKSLRLQYNSGVYDRTIQRYNSSVGRFVELAFDSVGNILVYSRDGTDSKGDFASFQVTDSNRGTVFGTAARFYIGLELKMRGEDLCQFRLASES